MVEGITVELVREIIKSMKDEPEQWKPSSQGYCVSRGYDDPRVWVRESSLRRVGDVTLGVHILTTSWLQRRRLRKAIKGLMKARTLLEFMKGKG